MRRVAVPLLALLALAAITPAGALADTRLRARAAAWAERQVGISEIGITNCGPSVSRWQRDMGLRVPPCRSWCGAFVHAAFLHAGVRLSVRMIDPHLAYWDAVAHRRHLRRIARRSVKRGDLVLFRYRPGVRASHFGIVTRDARPGDRFVHTVEGNAAHAVRRGVRRFSSVVIAARVGRAADGEQNG